MKGEHDKYRAKIKKINMMIFIAVELDPQYKFQFVEWNFKKLYKNIDAEFFSRKVKETCNDIFDSYRLFLNNNQIQNSKQSLGEVEISDFVAFVTLHLLWNLKKHKY